MKGDYNFIGSYYKELKTFKWGWDYIYINNQITRQLITTNTYYLKKIIDYILSLYNNEKVFDHEIEKITFYYDIKKMFLVNEFKIRNILELEILLAITLYITKSDLIYKLYNEKQKCNDYYILRNINIINK